MTSDPWLAPDSPVDWESFYASYRKPGYLPGYEILQKLGTGAFGIVFKARKQSIGKDYAVKFLRVEDSEIRAAVLKELELVQHFAQLDHPNLVAIEDRGIVDGIPYIVMSFAGEETLRTRLAKGPLPRAETLAVFEQVARGVSALHERSLVHFDLKPANVYLRGDVARVGDYGLSRVVTRSRNTLSVGRGTPYYMAPELLCRKGDHRSDIYSLGVMLYECLTGSVPFHGDSEWEVMRKHETEEPDWPRSIGPRDRRVLQRCLAKAPEVRFQSVDAMMAELQEPPVAAGIAGASTRRPAPRGEAAFDVAARLTPLETLRAQAIGEGAGCARGRSWWRCVMIVFATFFVFSWCARRGGGDLIARVRTSRANEAATPASVRAQVEKRGKPKTPAPAIKASECREPGWPQALQATALELIDWLDQRAFFAAHKLDELREMLDRLGEGR